MMSETQCYEQNDGPRTQILTVDYGQVFTTPPPHMWLMNVNTWAVFRVAVGWRNPVQETVRRPQSHGKPLCMDAGRKLVDVATDSTGSGEFLS